MLKRRTQYRGHCQCCGRLQAVRNGHVSAHGYTIKNGWCEGVCGGHFYPPIEDSREHADKVIKSVRDQVADLLEKSEAAMLGAHDPETFVSGHHYVYEPRFERVETVKPFSEASFTENGYIRRDISQKFERRARAGTQFANALSELVEDHHGHSLISVEIVCQ